MKSLKILRRVACPFFLGWVLFLPGSISAAAKEAEKRQEYHLHLDWSRWIGNIDEPPVVIVVSGLPEDTWEQIREQTQLLNLLRTPEEEYVTQRRRILESRLAAFPGPVAVEGLVRIGNASARATGPKVTLKGGYAYEMREAVTSKAMMGHYDRLRRHINDENFLSNLVRMQRDAEREMKRTRIHAETPSAAGLQAAANYDWLKNHLAPYLMGLHRTYHESSYAGIRKTVEDRWLAFETTLFSEIANVVESRITRTPVTIASNTFTLAPEEVTRALVRARSGGKTLYFRLDELPRGLVGSRVLRPQFLSNGE